MNRHRLQGLLMAALLCLGGCAASSTSISNDAASSTSISNDAAAAPEYAVGYAEDSGYSYSMDVNKEEMAEVDEVDDGEEETGGFLVDPSNAKRIYMADVNIQTQTFDEAITALRSLVRTNNGFIQDEDVSGMQEGAKQYASLTVRIPTESFDSFVDHLGDVGNVTRINKWTQNITKNYYDTKGMIDSLEKERDRLNELMAQADTVADLIAIEDKLFDVEQQLQSYQNDLSQMDLDVGYSTIYVSLSEVQVYTNESYSPWSQLGEAFTNTWVYFGDGVGELLIGLVYILPWLLLLALIGFLAYKGIRCLTKRWKKKHSTAHPDLPAMPPKPMNPPVEQPDSASEEPTDPSDDAASDE